MVGMLRVGFGCLTIFLLVVPMASGFGGRSVYGASASYYVPYSYYYYYWDPIPYYCPPAAPQVVPVPNAPAIPAPPRQTSEPPINEPRALKAPGNLQSPIIITTRSVGAFIPGSTPIPKDRCRVGFWNLSGQDVTLTIDNRTVQIAKDRAFTIDLERQFSWQANQQPQHVERIPEGQSTYEIVIR